MKIEEILKIREALKEWSKDVEILSAVGGAQEDLLLPDVEEREERAYIEENIFDTIYEHSKEGSWWLKDISRPTPPVTRNEYHLYRYFLDGSFRSYFLGTVIEGDRSSPIHYAQVGACVIFRFDDGTVTPELLEIRHFIFVNKKSLSDVAWEKLDRLIKGTASILEDLSVIDDYSKTLGEVDLRIRAGSKIRYKTRELEAKLLKSILNKLNQKTWLIVDGSLMFQPILRTLQEQYKETIPPVLGVSKNFRKEPQFVFGRGPKAKRFSIYSLLAHLKHEHRTPAFSALDGQVVFWYVRLRPQGQLDYPLMGVVKCELVTSDSKPVPTELIDQLSSCLVAERNVTPHGYDRRWHVHLYPIFLAERFILNSFYSREVIQQLMRWR